MLLHNVSAVLLALMLSYFARPGQLIRSVDDMVMRLDQILLNKHRTGPPVWLAGVCWIADLLWVPVMLTFSQPTIAQLVMLHADRPLNFLVFLIGCGVFLMFGMPWLETWIRRAPAHARVVANSEE